MSVDVMVSNPEESDSFLIDLRIAAAAFQFMITLCVLLGVGSVRADSPHVKIGFILPLSGDLAFLGSGIRDGALLAKDDLEKQGQQVELVFEDNRADLASSAKLAAKLIRSDKVAALVSIISGVGLILKPMAAHAKVLHVGICSDPAVADGRFSFVNYLTAEQGAQRYLAHFRVAIGASKSVVILQSNEAGFERISAELQRRAKGDPRVVGVHTFNSGSADFRALLLRVKRVAPDAIVLLGVSPDIELLARQARALGVSAALTSIEGFGLAVDRRAFAGGWFVDSAEPSADFQLRYRAKFGRQVTPGVGHAYDTVQMIVRSFQRGAPAEQFAENFRSIVGFPGVVGRLNVQSDGVVWSEAAVKTIDADGKLFTLLP